MRGRSSAGAVAVLIAACIFGAAMLVSLVTGAGVYRQVQERTEAAAAERLGLTYITAKIHSHDAEDSVRAGTFGGEDAVYLLEPLDGLTYETILYVYNGWLMELFCEEGWELKPEAGQQITEAQSLTVSEQDGLLRLSYVDGNGQSGTADVFLRSAG